MKLITFQSLDAVTDLFQKKYLECDETKINFKKVGPTYEWVVEKMQKTIKNPYNVSYPIWCWVKCYNGIAPSKRKGEKIDGYDVKITFNKEEKDVDYEVGQKVRRVIADIAEMMPEEMPTPKKSLKEIEREKKQLENEEQKKLEEIK